MRVLILGADGYIGWEACMYFSKLGHDVMGLDSLDKRQWEAWCDVEPLTSHGLPTFVERARRWNELPPGPRPISTTVCSLLNYKRLCEALITFDPECIIHLAEQPSAPFSMMGHDQAFQTQENNVLGTLNLIFAVLRSCPEAHIIKLGTMGEYGTPKIDIEEGWLTVTHNGRTDRLPFPKDPGSFYNLSKVHDSANLLFAAKNFKLRVTDLNQGVVYGTGTYPLGHPLATSFHYDDMFGTVLNRFVTQAVLGVPLTVYGRGHQRRAFLDLRDTMQCLSLASKAPPNPGEFLVMNQFTESFSIQALAILVSSVTGANVNFLENPRTIEKAEHHYNPSNANFKALGLEPLTLDEDTITNMLTYIEPLKTRIRAGLIQPRVRWSGV